MRVGLFVTCLADLMRPSIGLAAWKLLERAGCEVVVPASQTCCGQPGYNSGDRPAAQSLAKKLLAEFEDCDYVVAPSGSCGGMIRTHYPELLSEFPDLKARVDLLCRKTYELTGKVKMVMHLFSSPFVGLDGSKKATYGIYCETKDQQPWASVSPGQKVKVTGKKETDKEYMTYSGWKGGEKYTTVEQLRAKQPEQLIHRAVKGMIPKNRLGRVLLTKLKVYKGDKHPHSAQKPATLKAAN